MPNDDQAEADSREETTGVDPAMRAAAASGDLEAYRQEVAEILERGGEPADEENAADAEEMENADAGDEGVRDEEAQAKPKDRYRFKDPLDQAVAALAKARNIPLVEAARIIGGAAPAELPVEAIPGAAAAAGTRAREEISREIERVRQERKEALGDLEFERLGELDDRLEALREERESLHLKEAAQAAGRVWEQQAQLDAAFDQSMERAMAHYPDLADPGSDLYRLVLEMDERECRMGGPLANSADKPFELAWNAARQLGIAMADPLAAKPERKAAARKPVPPASGAARTTAPAARLEKALEGVRTQDDYDRLLDFLGATL